MRWHPMKSIHLTGNFNFSELQLAPILTIVEIFCRVIANFRWNWHIVRIERGWRAQITNWIRVRNWLEFPHFALSWLCRGGCGWLKRRRWQGQRNFISIFSLSQFSASSGFTIFHFIFSSTLFFSTQFVCQTGINRAVNLARSRRKTTRGCHSIPHNYWKEK